MEVEELTVLNFDEKVLKGPLPVMVDFWARRNKQGRLSGEYAEELAFEFKGKARVFRLNMDEEPEIPSRYDITVPTQLFFHNGRVVDKQQGPTSIQKLTEKLFEAALK